jgi:hypothetical protein
MPKTRDYVECRMKTASPKRRPSRRSPPKISPLEKSAVRIMRKLHEATGGQPQRWETLGNLGAVKSDAAAIAYAVERGLATDFRRPALVEPHRGWPATVEVAAALLPQSRANRIR